MDKDMHSQLHVSMKYKQSKLIIRILIGLIQLNRWGKDSYWQITTTIWHILQQNPVKIIWHILQQNPVKIMFAVF